MDTTQIDRLSRLLASARSRRTAVRALGGIATLATTSRLGLAPAAARDCLANGAACDPASAADCCTGACKKHKGKFKCAPAGSAQGCTKQLDGCLTTMATPCPHNPVGLCIGGQQGKPVCSTITTCAACHADADCAGLDPTARCIRSCSLCAASGNAACVVPAPPPT